MRAILTRSPADSRTRWDLVRLVLSRGAHSDAWAVLHETVPAPDPLTESDAVAWLHLNEEFATPHDLLSGALRLARKFRDSERVRGAVIGICILSNKGAVEATPKLVEQFRAEVEAFTEEWPESELFRAVQNLDQPDELLAKITEFVRPSAAELEGRRELSAKLARGELPLGVIASVYRRTYAEAVVLRGDDILPARHPDQAETAACVGSARSARGARVAIDVSATAVLSLLAPEVRSRVVGQYETVTVDDALADARAARASLQRVAGRLGWDDDANRPSLHEDDPNRRAENVRAIEAIISALEATHRVPAPPSTSPGVPDELASASWWRLIELARNEGIPLWADDAALRGLARSNGLEAFSTRSVLTGLRDDGILTTPSSEQFDRQLLEGRVGDLPLSAMLSAVQEVAEEDRWLPGRVAAALRRPAQWADPQDGIRVLQTVLPQVRVYAPAALPAWAYSAVRGVSLAFQASPAVGNAVVARVFGLVAYMAGVRGAAVGEIARATRAAMRDAALVPATGDDPVVNAIKAQYAAMKQALPDDVVAPYFLGIASGLDDEADTREIVELVLTDRTPGMSSGSLAP